MRSHVVGQRTWRAIVGLLSIIHLTGCEDLFFQMRSVARPQLDFCEATYDTSIRPCRANYVFVPCNSKLKVPSFCVAKYEMKGRKLWGAIATAGDFENCDPNQTICGASDPELDQLLNLPISTPRGTPWTRISKDAAKAKCEQVGQTLLSNRQWQSLARNLENVEANWVRDDFGKWKLPVGSSDIMFNGGRSQQSSASDSEGCFGLRLIDGTLLPFDCNGLTWSTGLSQRRTMTLSSGDVIWDVAGNVQEWVADDVSNLPFRLDLIGLSFVDYADTLMFPIGSPIRDFFGPESHIGSSEGAGKLNTGRVTSQRPTSMARSSSFRSEQVRGGSGSSGIFAGTFQFPSDPTLNFQTGFRCVMN